MPEVPVAWVRHVAGQCGPDSPLIAAALREGGLDPAVLTDSSERVPSKAFVRFLDAAARLSGDGLFGLTMGETYDIRASGLAAYTAIAAATLQEALANAVRYGSIVDTSARYGLVDHGTAVAFEVETGSAVLRTSRHTSEFKVAFTLTAGRRWVGQAFRPLEVSFVHQRRASAREVARRLGCPVRFGAERIDIRFARSQMALPLLGADPYLLALITRHADEVLARRRPSAEAFRGRVERIVLGTLPKPPPTAAQAAVALGVGERTFARRLAGEGTSFRQVVDELRADMARSYLANLELSIGQIAFLLGYSEQSAFTTAFRRWTGVSPGRYRSELVPV